MRYAKVKQTAFEELQLEAGILLNTFDPTGGIPIKDTDIICATKGGIEASLKYGFKDLAADVDNAPENIVEFMVTDTIEAMIKTTSISVTTETIRLACGLADIDDATGKVTPRRNIDITKDFKNIWWVSDIADGKGAAICVHNALSTGGFSLKSTKKGNGELALEFKGHFTLATQDVVPMDFYIVEAEQPETPPETIENNYYEDGKI